VGIFSKKYKFYIKRTTKESIPYQEIIEPTLGGPKWFANLCPYVGKKKRAIDRFPLPVLRGKTVKGCPGMLELFKNSFLVKFPCDLILETQKNGQYRAQKPTETEVLTLSHHREEQVELSEPLSSFIMIKFCFPFLYQAPNNKISFVDATYWKNQPYKIAPGILDFTNAKEALPLNIITFFEKKDKIYEFKKEDPMVLLYTLHRSTLEVNENLENTFAVSKTFSRRWP
jgi:hypothetical protein